jgi:hemoglobin-like flavoprotein
VAATRQPAVEQVQIAEESYRRCQGEAFFQAFYRRLLAADPSIAAKFAATDFDRQNKLLQHGFGLLFIFAKRPNPTLLDRIAERHGARDLDIAPPLYAHFTAALLATVAEADPAFDASVEAAWRAAVAPGIEFMQGRYS